MPRSPPPIPPPDKFNLCFYIVWTHGFKKFSDSLESWILNLFVWHYPKVTWWRSNLFIVIGGRVPYIYIYISVCVMSVSALFPFQRTITTINQQNSMNTLQIPTDSHIRAGIPGGLPYVYIYTHTYTDPLCFWPRLYGAGAALSVLPFCRFPRLAQWCQGRVSRGHGDLRNMGVPQ